MTMTQALRRMLAVGTMMLLAVAAAPHRSVHAQAQGFGLTGTWFVRVGTGLAGFITYSQDGTLTGAFSSMFTGAPQAGSMVTDNSPDHGIWRQAGGGFEAAIYRMNFDPDSGDVASIVRIRMSFAFNPGAEDTFGTYAVDQWICPDALSCPDPNTTVPDVANIIPPAPFNTFTQTRMRLP